MSADDIRTQKGLTLLEQLEATSEVDTIQKNLAGVIAELRRLADFLERYESGSVDAFPADWRSLSSNAFSFFEQLQDAKERLNTANAKLRHFGLS